MSQSNRSVTPGAAPALTPWLMAGFGAVSAVLVIAMVVGLASLREVNGAADMVAHTHEVQAALRELLSTVVDAETAQRGFIITGDEAYLEPYNRSLSVISADIDRVRKLTSDNPAQTEDMGRLYVATTNRLAIIAENLRLRRESGFASAQSGIAGGLGKQAMDDMRAIVARMESREDALLAIRRVDSARRYRLAQVIDLATPLLALLILALLFAGTRRFGAERRNAEQIAERLNVTLKSIGDGVITTDHEGRVLRLNPIAQALMGWTEEDAAGKPLDEVLVLINEQTRRPTENPIGRVLREGTTVGLANHTILISKDGREIPIDDSAAPIRDANGRILGVIMVFRDITERHRAELERAKLMEGERVARNAAETANRTKDEFLAMVSHELRTPLHAILGWADMLRSGTLPAERRGRAIDAVYASAVRQAKLIDQLLDISRIMSGKLQLEPAEIDLTAVMRNAVDMVQPSADARRIQLTIGTDPEVGPFYADAARLQQVVGNLLSNAIKFTPDGGAVRLALRGTEDGVALTVTDTGQGIPHEFIPFVFEPFRQADQLTTRRQGGLGLGLSIVKHIVEAHGGTVHAESAGTDQGSTFTVRLPVQAAPAGVQKAGELPETAARAQTADTRLQGIVVLAVDDDQDSRDLVSATLEKQGAVVVTAASAEQALEILRSTSVHVLLSDVAMSGEDGYMLIRRIRAAEAGRHARVPAATLTSLAREEDRRESIRAGFQLHLTKPIDAPTLVDAVAKLAQGAPRL